MGLPDHWHGKYKKIARQIALDYISDPNCAAIFLPGIDSEDVKTALNKTITQDKFLYLVEREKYIVPSIEQYIKPNFNSYKLHNGEIESLKITKLIDLAYLDFIGSMNDKIYNWIKLEIVPNLARDSRISLCFNFAWRPEVPFLINKYNKYREKDEIFKIASNYVESSYQICTYFLILKELFPNHRFVFHQTKPYYRYNDNVNPMVLYTLESNQKEEKIMETVIVSRVKKVKKLLPSRDLKTLVDQFPQACQNPDKLRGWKRARTLYCNWKAKENGTSPEDVRRGVKRACTCRGYDTSKF